MSLYTYIASFHVLQTNSFHNGLHFILRILFTFKAYIVRIYNMHCDFYFVFLDEIKDQL